MCISNATYILCSRGYIDLIGYSPCSEESSVIIHSDDAYAPVAYLKLNKLVLRDKQVINS